MQEQFEAFSLKPQTENIRSLEEIAAEYRHVRSQWEKEAACRELKRHVTNIDVFPVSRAVCLGIGTFDPPDGGWETKRRTFVQLMAFLTMVECLEKKNGSKIECTFQEPIFTASDKKFIESLGHKVVETPGGFEHINTCTALFGVHLYRPIYAKALEGDLPAIFVGTDLDVWDWVTFGKTENDIVCTSNVKIMENTYSKRKFPQDASTTAFTSTSFYWRSSKEVMPQGQKSKGEPSLDWEKDSTPVETLKDRPDDDKQQLSKPKQYLSESHKSVETTSFPETPSSKVQ
ncbi:SRR1 [Geosmithia morbida]|uniref:SRR1 n=1 Tax=Geosmithia morbida TaxID=1094350 RepID=A0A9P4YN01_9HYPO|nr:SRR1 [Geosmithia morbida]KAF4119946.1 SRR1 [Geosmithia morbida]